MSDLSIVGLAVFSGGFVAIGLFVLYGAGLGGHPTIVEFRRIFVWVVPQFPGPSATALAGFLPLGAAFLILALGRYLAGATFTLDGFPGNVGQNLMLVGIGLFVVAIWFAIYPPMWALPEWYRDFLRRRRRGLEPDIPKPRGGSELKMTRTHFRVLSVGLGLFVAAVHVFDWPLRWAGTALMSLALLGAYRIRERPQDTEPLASSRPLAVTDRDWEAWLAGLDEGVTYRGGEAYLTPDTALKALAWIEASGSRVLGLEGFRLARAEIRPSLAHIADFSVLPAGRDGSSRSVAAAREALKAWRGQIDAVVVDIDFGAVPER